MNIVNLTDMTNVFCGESAISKIYVNNDIVWEDTTNVTDMSKMFTECKNIKSTTQKKKYKTLKDIM